jgi:hypothetical protein
VGQSRRIFGTLESWHASEHGGFGFVTTPSGGKYFLHRKYIKSGSPIPGASAVFEVLPPAAGTTNPRAINANLNANVPSAKETKIAPKVPVNAVTSPEGAEA